MSLGAGEDDQTARACGLAGHIDGAIDDPVRGDPEPDARCVPPVTLEATGDSVPRYVADLLGRYDVAAADISGPLRCVRRRDDRNGACNECGDPGRKDRK